MSMYDRVPRRASCLFCGQTVEWDENRDSTGVPQWCEDGCPVHCDRHFDEGGWELICADKAACDARRAENRKTAAARRAERAVEESAEKERRVVLTRDDAAAVSRLLAGLHATGYSPYYTTDTIRALGEPVLTRQTGSDARLPNNCGWTRIYRCPEGFVSVFTNGADTYVVTGWSTREQCDAWRATKAIEMEVTEDDARDGLGSDYIGDDQRRMYEVAAERHAANK